jgi:hypothetical protein
MRLDGMGDPWTPYLNDVHMEFVLDVTEASASNTSTSDPTSNSASNSASNAGSNAGSNSASHVHRDHGNSDDAGTDDRVFDDDESSRTSEEIDLMKTRRTHYFESTTHLGSARYPDFTTATSRIDSPADSEVKEKTDTLSASSYPSTTSSRLYIPSSNGFPS